MQITAKVVRSDTDNVKISVVDGQLSVEAPWEIAENELIKILRDSASWYGNKIECKAIDAELSNCGEQNVVDFVSDLFSCKKVLIAGKVFDVVSGDVAKTILQNDCVVVSEKAYLDSSKRKKAVCSFIKLLAKQWLRQEISQFGTKVALCPAAINLTALKNSGWIRCADMSNKVVSIDYRAIQLPYDLRRYLIAHAFAHFYTLGHDKEYWTVLQKFAPNFELMQKKLRDYTFLKEIV